MKAKVQNRLTLAMVFVLVLTIAIACAFSLSELSIASATDALPEEVTYFSGIRSSTTNTIYAYWRLDGASLGSPSATGIAIDWYTAGSDTPTTKYVKLSYATVSAQNQLNTGSTALRNSATYVDTTLKSSAPAIKIDWFSDEACKTAFTATSGDTFTLPSGTAFSSATTKYVLNQDYTFTFGGSANTWALSEETHIPVGLDGVRSAAGTGTHIYAYGMRLLDNYIYSYHDGTSQGYTRLNNAVSFDYYADDATTTPTTVSGNIQLEKASTENKINDVVQYGNILHIQITTAASVGGRVVLKKGTIVDNYVIDRNYTFTQVSTDKWYMTADTTEDDPAMELTVRGNNLKTGEGIYFFTKSELPFAADERFAKNTPIEINGEVVYIDRMAGLAQSGDYSFAMFFSARTAGDLVKLPAGMYIAGYRLAKTYNVKYVDSTTGWIFVECDGTNHVYNDEYTCHDRTCACGHVEVATTEHVSPIDKEVCEERNCTDCGEAITPDAHTFEAGTYECQDRTCTVCENLIEATSEHTPVGEGCEATCSQCQMSFGNHEWATAPEGGWTIDSEGVTVGTQPDCDTTGIGTIKCANCTVTQEIVINALGHNVPEGEKFCSREGCTYRIPYTESDMEEVLGLENLTKYQYSDSHVFDSNSVFGQIRTPEGASAYENNFLINAKKDNEGNYVYEEGKADVHNMMISFSLNLSQYATNGRSSYVWMMAHENGQFGIGFMFCFYSSGANLRVRYKSDDGKDMSAIADKKLTGFALNQEQKFDLGVVQNSDGSFFIFAYYNDALFFTGTLTNEQLESNANEATHNGLGGAIGMIFNGSSSIASPVGTICNKQHIAKLGDGEEQYACKDYNCSICNAQILHTVDHNWGAGVSNNDGDCNNKETFTYTCSTCQSTQEREGDFVHAWGSEPVIVKNAECGGVLAQGYYVCGECEVHSETKDIEGSADALPDSCELEEYVITPATCVEEGELGFKCKHCGLVDEESGTEPIAIVDHTYGEEIEATKPSCDGNGMQAHYECSVCEKLFTKDGDVYTEVQAEDITIPATHTYSEEVAEVEKTCTTAGTMAHYTCTECNKLFTKNGDVYTEVQADDLVIPASHEYGTEIAEEPATCKTEGKAAHYECSDCGKLFTKSSDVYTEVEEADLVLAKVDHVYGSEVAEVEKTCTTAGTMAHYECSVCDKLFTKDGDVYTEVQADDLVIPASHEYGTEIAEEPATCKTEGKAAHYECADCGKLFTKSGDVYTEVEEADLVLAKVDHVYGTEIEATEPSCDGNGMQAHYECSVCEKLFTKDGDVYTEVQAEDITIPATHTYSTEIAEEPATCTTAGTMAHYTCTKCNKLFTKSGDVYTEVQEDDLVIPATHSYEFVMEDPATCQETGTKAHYECSVCDKLFTKSGDVYTEAEADDLVIAKADHNYSNGICSTCEGRDEVYFFDAKISAVNSATTAEGKFVAIKEAIAQYANLSDDEQTANANKLAGVIASYNQMAQDANQAHAAQNDIFTDILKLLSEIAAMTSLLAVGLYLAKMTI